MSVFGPGNPPTKVATIPVLIRCPDDGPVQRRLYVGRPDNPHCAVVLSVSTTEMLLTRPDAFRLLHALMHALDERSEPS